MAQEPKKIDLMVALNILDQVLDVYLKKGEKLNWNKNPGLVVMELMAAADVEGDTYTIEYNKAISILNKVRGSKMNYDPGSNKGMEEIKQRWKKSYII